MKREVIVALAYGVVGLIVGGLLIWLERPGRSRESVAGSEDRLEESGNDPGRSAEGESEIGPDGIRWLMEPAEVGVGIGVTGNGVGGMREPEGRTTGEPEGGRALLALGDPVVRGVAEILVEAGLSAPALEMSLRDVYGHVQRLAVFRWLARNDEELAAALEAQARGGDEGERGDLPDLRWRAAVWPRRIEEYTGYVGRDLEARLGITDVAVVGRLVAMADAMSEGMRATAGPATIVDSGREGREGR